MQNLIVKDECYKIIGACFEVYKEKGNGFLEAVYQECLELECGLQAAPFCRSQNCSSPKKGETLTQIYKPDLICFDQVIVELKAVSQLTNEYRAQVHSYLKASDHRLALLVDFGHHPQLEWERIVR